MVGGFLSGASLVTKNDLDGAENSITQEAKDSAKSALLSDLQSEAKSSFAFLESAIQTEVIEAVPSAVEGQEITSFNYQVKAVSKTMIFSKAVLEDFVKDYIISKYSESKEVWDDSLEISYSPQSINLASGKMVLSLDVSAKVHDSIDVSKLKEVVSDKSLSGSKVFLENQAGVTKAEVEFWPFWVKRAPKDIDKIEITLRID
jgi:hypothetical protein